MEKKTTAPLKNIYIFLLLVWIFSPIPAHLPNMSCLLVCCMNGDEAHTTIQCHFSFTGSVGAPELFDLCISHNQRIEHRSGIRPGPLTSATRLSNTGLSHWVRFSDEEMEVRGALCVSPDITHTEMLLLIKQQIENSRVGTQIEQLAREPLGAQKPGAVPSETQ